MAARSDRGKGWTWLAALSALVAAGCSGLSGDAEGRVPKSIPADCQQAIVVASAGTHPFQVRVIALERKTSTWKPAFPAMAGTIGRNGFAPVDQKREGDGKTPTGIYPVRLAFGYDHAMETGLKYRQATVTDYWVDDPKSLDYNRWIVGRPPTCSHEKMRRTDDLYRFGAVIEYNTEPVVPGLGSAVFLHVWGGPDAPTAGCVALEEENVRNLLRWLHRDRKPHFVLGSVP